MLSTNWFWVSLKAVCARIQKKLRPQCRLEPAVRDWLFAGVDLCRHSCSTIPYPSRRPTYLQESILGRCTVLPIHLLYVIACQAAADGRRVPSLVLWFVRPETEVAASDAPCVLLKLLTAVSSRCREMCPTFCRQQGMPSVPKTPPISAEWVLLPPATP